MQITRFILAALAAALGAVVATHVALLSAQATTQTATADEARAFLDEVDRSMLRLGASSNRAGWVQNTYITVDTEQMNAQANEAYIRAVADFAKRATRFDGLQLPPDVLRRLYLLKVALTMPAPSDAEKAGELTRIAAEMEGSYGRGKYCPPGGADCLDIEAITRVMAENRDPKRLREVWEGWHTISVPMKQEYARFVHLSNEGARELGFTDTGVLWRARYDMPPARFPKELDRLWDQLRPLYTSLHAYVRWKLRERYGDAVPANGPIPAHLLGNLWAQEWSNVYDLVAPAGADPGYSLDRILKAKNTTPVEMVRYGERFFTSLGFAPLPSTFWERSLFVKPRDRDVVCHASAWDIDLVDDLRIKMCIDITAEDFTAIHHELGHNFYQRAYSRLPVIYRDAANDGFHEAIGDTIGLSVTPEYLVKIGLLDKAPDPSKDIGLLLRDALDRLAFLPFGLLVDQWRWQVFSGQVPSADYNKAWWALRLKYQGVAPPSPRGEEFFDPGAKYHVPANTPYARYFLARVLEFQFHRALAKEAGCTTALNRCSIYGSRAAGAKLNAVLEMGQSRPWPEALQALTGQTQMDATAMRDYFAPLQKWLNEQNQGKPVGW